VDETKVDQRLWNSICRRLCYGVSGQEPNPRFVRGSGAYIEGHPFEGIIHEMTKQCGGNVHEKGVVRIASSSDERNQPFQVANHGWDNYWHTRNEPNSWICFDFKERSVAVSQYTLKSHPSLGHWFISWVIEGSSDGSSWRTLDTRETQDLNGQSIVKTYRCSNGCTEFFRYIRMRHTGKTSHNADVLLLTNIEFFGRVRE
jgi:hypothetical protein